MKLRATAQQQLWPSQLGLCWFDLEVLQLHGHAHVPRDLQLPLEERLNGRDGERAQIKKKDAWDPIRQQLSWWLQGLRRGRSSESCNHILTVTENADSD